MTKYFEDGSDYTEDVKYKEPKIRRQHKTTGYCLACNAAVHDRAFCDNWCREDYEFEQEMRKLIIKTKR